MQPRLLVLGVLGVVGCERARATSSPQADAAPPPPPVLVDAAVAAAVPAPPPTIGPLLIVHDGQIVIGRARGGHGPARLDAGEVPVDEFDGPADHGFFAASRAADPARVPPDAAAWLGRTLLLGGTKGRCMGAVTGLRVIAEVYGLDEDMLAVGDDAGELAAEIVASGHPVLVGVVTAPCAADASWAVPAGSLAPIPWTNAYGHLSAPGGAVALDVDLEDDGCPDNARYTLRDGKRAVASGQRPLDLRDVIDVDHDGWPELVLADGWMHADAPRHRYQRTDVLHFESDWYQCIE